MNPDTREQIMSGPRGGVAGLLGGLRAASKSEGIYDAGKGGNWFEEMFLKRTGGGGQDYMIHAEAKDRDLTEIMTIGPRDDLKAKKIAQDICDNQNKRFDNRCQIINLFDSPFGRLRERKIKHY